MKYGCHNREAYRHGFFVQDGWKYEGQIKHAKVKFTPFRMEQSCQYTKTDLGRADQKCSDCIHKATH